MNNHQKVNEGFGQTISLLLLITTALETMMKTVLQFLLIKCPTRKNICNNNKQTAKYNDEDCRPTVVMMIH